MNAQLPADETGALSLVHYLTMATLPAGAQCDQDQIDSLGELAVGRREHALSVLAKGLAVRFSVEMRLRLIELMRAMRGAQRHAGARFLLDLFGILEPGSALFARENALQAGAEGPPLLALESWKAALLAHKDPLAISHLAYHLPELAKLEPETLLPCLTAYVDSLIAIAPTMANNEVTFKDIEPRLEALNKALIAHGYQQEARALGKLAIDLKIKWAFSF